MKSYRNLTAIIIALVLLTSVGCQTASNTNTAVNQNANKSVVNANTATPEAATPTSSNTSGTPTDAYKAAYAARKNKDVPGLKKLLSKDILQFFTEISGLGEKKQTLDELLMELCEKPQAPTAETRNEKINGNKATVEYLDEKGDWPKMDFIMEDGSWKLTIEKPEKGDIQIDNGMNKNTNRK